MSQCTVVTETLVIMGARLMPSPWCHPLHLVLLLVPEVVLELPDVCDGAFKGSFCNKGDRSFWVLAIVPLTCLR